METHTQHQNYGSKFSAITKTEEFSPLVSHVNHGDISHSLNGLVSSHKVPTVHTKTIIPKSSEPCPYSNKKVKSHHSTNLEKGRGKQTNVGTPGFKLASPNGKPIPLDISLPKV